VRVNQLQEWVRFVRAEGVPPVDEQEFALFNAGLRVARGEFVAFHSLCALLPEDVRHTCSVVPL